MIPGKRSREVPVLFITVMQQNQDVIIFLRNKYIEQNKFLFENPSGSQIRRYTVLQKHVKLCGAKYPEANHQLSSENI